jgi:hypothetical protein
MAPFIRTTPLRHCRRSSSPLKESNTINTPPLKPLMLPEPLKLESIKSTSIPCIILVSMAPLRHY